MLVIFRIIIIIIIVIIKLSDNKKQEKVVCGSDTNETVECHAKLSELSPVVTLCALQLLNEYVLLLLSVRLWVRFMAMAALFQ